MKLKICAPPDVSKTETSAGLSRMHETLTIYYVFWEAHGLGMALYSAIPN